MTQHRRCALRLRERDQLRRARGRRHGGARVVAEAVADERAGRRDPRADRDTAGGGRLDADRGLGRPRTRRRRSRASSGRTVRRLDRPLEARRLTAARAGSRVQARSTPRWSDGGPVVVGAIPSCRISVRGTPLQGDGVARGRRRPLHVHPPEDAAGAQVTGTVSVRAPGSQAATASFRFAVGESLTALPTEIVPELRMSALRPPRWSELVDDPRARQRLEVQARLAELDAEALDLADAEALADEVVQPHAADDDLPARLRPGEADVLEHLGLDQRERAARALPARRRSAGRLRAPARRPRRPTRRARSASDSPIVIASTFMRSRLTRSGRQLADRAERRGRPRRPRRRAGSARSGSRCSAIPAAFAERMPLWESSTATQLGGSAPSRRAASR